MRLVLFFLVLGFIGIESQAGKKFASPTGTETADGNSKSSPLSLSKAFSSSSPLQPGDSLVLLEGVYEGNFTLEKSGTDSQPIYILAETDGKVIIDPGKNRTNGTGIIINASNVWLIGLHITSSSLMKREDLGETVPYESGITVFGPNVKLINCWIYDIPGGGLELWRPALNLEVYGCVIFNNGSQSTERGTGHGMYIQHDDPNFPKTIKNNIVFQNASQGINIFTTNPPNGGVIVSENTAFNTGVIANFDENLFRPPHNFTVGSTNEVSFWIRAYDNVFYSDLQKDRISKSQVGNVSLGRTYQPNQDFQFYNNTLFGGSNQVEIQPLETFRFTENTFFNVHGKFFQFLTLPQALPNTTWDSNTYYLLNPDELSFTGLNFLNWKSNSGFDSNSNFTTSNPTTPKIWVRRNQYDQSKFYVTILNPGNLENIPVDFSSYSIATGSKYELIDFQNPFDNSAKLEGTYQNGTISFPMNRTTSLAPKGNMPHDPVHTESTFGVFQILFTNEINFPALKDTAIMYLDNEGKGIITPEIILKDVPNPDFSYGYSIGPELSCQHVGFRQLIVTATHLPSTTELKDTITLRVLDTIPPMFDAGDGYVFFDPLIGRATYNLPDFDVTLPTDNCSKVFDIRINGPEINCALMESLSGSIPKFPVKITVFDQYGNKSEKNVFIHVTWIESKKVSISSQKQLDSSGSILVLGNEMNYQVKAWYRNGQIIPDQKSKELPINSSGAYYARLILPTGCEVNSRVLNFETNLPEHRDLVELSLNTIGKATLSFSNIFIDSPFDSQNWKINKVEFNCANLGENWVKVTYTTPLIPTSYENSYLFEFWVKINVVDKVSPVVSTKEAVYEFDLSKGELEFNPLDFIKSPPQDNCPSENLTLSLSKPKITCADVDSERVTYYIDLNVIVTDASGNSSVNPTSALLYLVESQKVSISQDNPLFPGGSVKLTLGSELEYEVIEWRKDLNQLPNQVGNSIEVNEPGVYTAILKLKNGCVVSSEGLELVLSELPFPPVKETVELNLGEDGKAELSISQLFTVWPFQSAGLTFELSQSQFDCTEIGDKKIKLFIKKTESNQVWEREITILVRDTRKPVLIPKTLDLELDVTIGKAEITPNQILELSQDNCSIKSLTISKSTFTCEDLGKEISVGIRAEDQSGNVTEAVAIVNVKRKESQPIQITGQKEICQGEKAILELSGSATFEVVRWRRNGVEISGQTGKTLETGEPGVYHAVIRYSGGCLSESQNFELKVNPKPTGEIKTDGNKLIAPEGSFTYQWFRNGEKLDGKTSRILEVNQMGEYSVELTNEAGCKAFLPTVTMTIAGLGGSWVKSPENLKIYPNPASVSTKVDLPLEKLGSEKIEFRLYDLDGKEVSSEISWVRIEEDVLELYLNDLPKGTYLVWVFGSNQSSFVGKLVIQ